jgi:transcriptional regulator with XRE-family HTH domain
MILRIKELAKKKGMGIGILAENIGIAQPSMSNIVNEKVMPSVETLQKIADVLNVHISELFSKEDDISGFIKTKGKVYEINSIEDIKRLLQEL